MKALLTIAALFVANPVFAASDATIVGDYVCESGCRVTDAYPSVAIEGDRAICMNEFGGVFEGRALSARSVSCFNKTGALSDDGQTIRWGDGGMVWRRAPAR